MEATLPFASNSRSHLSMYPFLARLPTVMAVLFSGIFVIFAMYLCGISVYKLVAGIGSQNDLVETLIKSINFAIVGLAVFELAVSIQQEYVGRERDGNVIFDLRRSIARFISVVCTALALEGLMMSIKYSQLDLAGNLYYSVAIIVSAAVLLLALGVFLHLTRGETPDETKEPNSSSVARSNHVIPAGDSTQ